MSQDRIISKYVEFLNEALSAENAAVDRITSRMDQTPITELKQRFQQHLEETSKQQERLTRVINQLGGKPTDSKAHLPMLAPPSTMMIKKTIKDSLESITDNGKENPLPEEMELMLIKQDALVEGAEIVGYETLIEISQRFDSLPSDGNEIITELKQSLQEEKDMHKWCKTNIPMAVGILLPKILSAVGG
jgi:ferritin-like metal-binding protein YciE